MNEYTNDYGNIISAITWQEHIYTKAVSVFNMKTLKIKLNR